MNAIVHRIYIQSRTQYCSSHIALARDQLAHMPTIHIYSDFFFAWIPLWYANKYLVITSKMIGFKYTIFQFHELKRREKEKKNQIMSTTHSNLWREPQTMDLTTLLMGGIEKWRLYKIDGNKWEIHKDRSHSLYIYICGYFSSRQKPTLGN